MVDQRRRQQLLLCYGKVHSFSDKLNRYIALVKSQKEINLFDHPPLDGTVVVLHTLTIMIMTFRSYARVLEDLFQFDTRCSYTSVAYGRPLTTKTSNVTYLTLI